MNHWIVHLNIPLVYNRTPSDSADSDYRISFDKDKDKDYPTSY